MKKIKALFKPKANSKEEVALCIMLIMCTLFKASAMVIFIMILTH